MNLRLHDINKIMKGGSMHFIVYETTNLVNGKKYRGAHVTASLNDGI